jgi:hypothetical protein
VTNRHLFGWMEERVCVTSRDFSISPVSGFDAAVCEGIKFYAVDNDWFDTKEVPKRFELPVTHELTVDPTIDDHLAHLLISVFGFLHGLKLNPEGIGYLHKTPRKLGKLVNFTVPGANEIRKCLNAVISFYTDNISKDPEIIELMIAGLHWYLTSQSYDHDFEKFAWQYSVLDNIHRLKCLSDSKYRKITKGKGHPQRPVSLHSRYGVVLHRAFSKPVGNGNAKALAKYRNQLIHEARWIDRPLGYAVGRESHYLTLALTQFNSQLILQSLGIKCRFSKLDADMLVPASLGLE